MKPLRRYRILLPETASDLVDVGIEETIIEEAIAFASIGKTVATPVNADLDLQVVFISLVVDALTPLIDYTRGHIQKVLDIIIVLHLVKFDQTKNQVQYFTYELVLLLCFST